MLLNNLKLSHQLKSLYSSKSPWETGGHNESTTPAISFCIPRFTIQTSGLRNEHMSTRQGGESISIPKKQLISKTFVATTHLLVHIVLRANEHRVLRSFSITKDFESGGQPITFADMDELTRKAVETISKRINEQASANPEDPLDTVFALWKMKRLLGAYGWENVTTLRPHEPATSANLVDFGVRYYSCLNV